MKLRIIAFLSIIAFQTSAVTLQELLDNGHHPCWEAIPNPMAQMAIRAGIRSALDQNNSISERISTLQLIVASILPNILEPTGCANTFLNLVLLEITALRALATLPPRQLPNDHSFDGWDISIDLSGSG